MNYKSQIMNTYKSIRDENKQDLIMKKQEIYNTIPEFKDIDQTIVDLGIEISKIILSKKSDYDLELYELRQSVAFSKKRKKELLIKNGYPENYLDEKYTCLLCKDTGFTETNQKCTCYKQKLIEQAYKMSNMQKQMASENFNTFNIDVFSGERINNEGKSQRENMLDILSRCESFTHNFGKHNENLYLYGPPGLGKTFLCNAIAKSLIEKGHTVLYQTPFSIIDILEEKTFGSKKPEIFEMYHFLLDVDLLIIDDLGVENTNSFIKSEFFNIFNTRILNKKSTIISTNITPAQIVLKYSERIDSRIKGHYRLIKFFGPDIRWQYKGK